MTGDGDATLGPAALARLAEVAQASGLERLGIVRLDHEGFAEAHTRLDRWLAEGRAGEMEFMVRTREVRTDPARMLPGARSLLVALVPYDGEPGAIARYARSADYHTVVHRRLERVVVELQRLLPAVRAMICVDTKPVLERSAAALAGLGFLGKNGCLIAPGLGSYVLLGAVLSTARWAGADAVDDRAKLKWDACGSCTRCLDACPTGAFTAAGELDPRRCISYLTIEHRGAIADELADAIGDRIAGCDVCQEVCPYNAAALRGERISPQTRLGPPRNGWRRVDPVALVAIGSATYRAWVKDTPVSRIPRRSMKRNALIALGNRDGVLAEGERAAIEGALDDPDALVRSAATRALARRRPSGSG